MTRCRSVATIGPIWVFSPLQGVGKLGKAADAAANARIKGTVAGNELDLAAAAILLLYDEGRKVTEVKRHAAVDAARGGAHGSNPAADLGAYAADAAKNPALWLPSGEPEFDELTAAFAPTLAAVGGRAAAYWDVIGRAFEDFQKSGFQFTELMVSLTKWSTYPPQKVN